MEIRIKTEYAKCTHLDILCTYFTLCSETKKSSNENDLHNIFWTLSVIKDCIFIIIQYFKFSAVVVMTKADL